VHKLAGETVSNRYFHGTDFPVLNLHSHACAMYSATKLFGLEFTEDGLAISPDMPVESYRFESPLVGVIKQAGGIYEGWYAPSQAGNWTIRIAFPQRPVLKVARAEINGAAVPMTAPVGNVLTLAGKSAPGKPLRWRVQTD
jgi:hypothetical protein